MKNSILSLEGVEVLSKKQMKVVNGGKAAKDCNLTGNEQGVYSAGVLVSWVCEWKCTSSFLGINLGSETHWGGCSVWG